MCPRFCFWFCNIIQPFIDVFCAGIMISAYDGAFIKRRHQLMSMIIQQVSSEKQCFEERVHKHLRNFISSVNKNNGQPINPLPDLLNCVIGINLNSIFGCQFENSHPLLQQIKITAPVINEAMFTLEVFPALRFLPPYRKRMNDLMDMISWVKTQFLYSYLGYQSKQNRW